MPHRRAIPGAHDSAPGWAWWCALIILLVLASPELLAAWRSNQVGLQLLDTIPTRSGLAFPWPGVASPGAAAAQEQARRLVEADPERARSWYLLGVASINNGDPETAIAAFAQVDDQEVDPALTFHHLGSAYRLSQNPRLAVQSWYRAGDTLSAFLWGGELLAARDYQKARALFEAMIDYEPFLGHYWLGVTWAQDGQWDRALGEFELAYTINPAQPQVLVDLSRALYYTGGDRARAEALIRQAEPLLPDNAWMATVLSEMYQVVGDQERATRWEQQLARINRATVER